MREEGKGGPHLPTVDEPSAGVFICKLEIVRNMYSTRKMSIRGRKTRI